MTVSALISLFDYKRWANTELFTCLQYLPPHQESTLQSCLRTLNHIYLVDKIFQTHLSGLANPYKAPHSETTPGLDELRACVVQTDDWYVDYVARLNDARLQEQLSFTFTDGDKGAMSREEILFHVSTHGAYHRGNVGQMLRSIAVAPPRDLFTKFLHVSEPARRLV